MSTNTIPKDVLNNLHVANSREFKSLKRKQIRALIKAFEEYQLGCYYCPEYKSFDKARQHVEKIKQAQSVKTWGR